MDMNDVPDLNGVDTPAFIGASGRGAYFNGLIDDVRVYNHGGDPCEECFPVCHDDYAEWVRVGRPECWCFVSQCVGDADGLPEGSDKAGHKKVFLNDLAILEAAWDVKEPPDGPGIASVDQGICADFDHKAEGSTKAGFKRVFIQDLDLLVANWNVLEPSNDPNASGPGIDANCLDCTAAASAMAARGAVPLAVAAEPTPDFAAIGMFLEQLWLDDVAMSRIDEDSLLMFTKSLAEAVKEQSFP